MCAERLALYTTIYPGVEPYLADWSDSVAAQTDRDFDLVVSLDAISPDDVAAACGRPVAAEWLRNGAGRSPAEIRSRALTELVDRYPAVVLVDSDDLLHPSRVAAARRMLREVDVCGCALAFVDASGAALGSLFQPPPGVAPAELLPRYNVFGLSNTAYRSGTLGECLPVPADCTLMDWLLATRAWSAGASLGFDATPRMAYRQHPANMAPVLPPFGEEQVTTATRRVLAHYGFLLDRGWPLPAEHRRRLEAERVRVETFAGGICRPDVLFDYVEALNRLEPVRVWWWLVANPKLEAVWNC